MLHDQLPKQFYTKAQQKALERHLISYKGFTEYGLIQAGAKDTLEAVSESWPEARAMIIICGSGLKAGVGYSLAVLALQSHIDVSIYYLTDPNELSGSIKAAVDACKALNIPIKPFQEDISIDTANPAILIDAMLEEVLAPDRREPYAAATHWVNDQSAMILSLDFPSGLDPDTGVSQGFVVKCDLTVCYLVCKRGLFTGDGVDCTGQIIWSDLKVPPEFFIDFKETCAPMDVREVFLAMPARYSNLNESDVGHVLVVGGNTGMAGAVCLAGSAALYTGAGLVSVATRPEHVGIVTAYRPEAMSYGIRHPDDLLELLARATVVVLGPGLGRDEWAQQLWYRVLQSDLPIILSSDALNVLAEQALKSTNWILTPSPGEAARLLKTTVADIEADRFQASKACQEQYGGIVVLKGSGTIVTTKKQHQWLDLDGNPGMLAPGMADCLSGIIAGLIAQKLDMVNAACVGVMVYGAAADRTEDSVGERGLLAGDLLPFVRQIVNIG